ncbi:beta-1,4-glucuronyltransferase 1-like [Glandiceps talaboti]
MSLKFIPLRKCSVKTVVLVVLAVVVVRQLASIIDSHVEEDVKLKTLPKHHRGIAGAILYSTGQYKVQSYLVTSEAITWNQVKRDDVTIATHSTLHELHHLPTLVERWNAPVSVAVLTSDVTTLLSTIANFRRCFPLIKQHASFHIIIPANIKPDDAIDGSDMVPEMELKVPCSMVLDLTDNLIDQNITTKDASYPSSLLQNIAWKESITDYIFTLNIDMMPSGELEQSFKAFIVRQQENQEVNHHMVFVIPDFDLDDEYISTPPKYKAEVLDLLKKNSVKPHGSFVNYTQWTNFQSTSSLYLEVAFEMKGQSPWHAYFIASRDIPKFDENFNDINKGRSSHVCELHVAGFQFAVLDSAFALHSGTKRPEDNRGRDQFQLKEFEEKLKRVYPQSLRSCS